MDNQSLTKELLEDLYLSKEMTIKEIGNLTHHSPSYICNQMRLFGIEARHQLNEKAINKISLSKKGMLSPWKGKHHTQETKEKLSEAHKGMVKNKTKYGGHIKNRKDGYVSIYVPDHPSSSKDGYVMEHILVMEESIGRYVQENEVVHHLNHIRNDNRLENLQLMTKKEHAAFHLQARKQDGLLGHYTVRVRNKTTGEVFNSVKEAGQRYSVSPNNISYACSGKIKTVKKCEWEYLKED